MVITISSGEGFGGSVCSRASLEFGKNYAVVVFRKSVEVYEGDVEDGDGCEQNSNDNLHSTGP